LKQRAAERDVVILATNWVKVPDELKGIDWRGRILIDVTNAHMDPKPDILTSLSATGNARLGHRESVSVALAWSPGGVVLRVTSNLREYIWKWLPHAAGRAEINRTAHRAELFVIALFMMISSAGAQEFYLHDGDRLTFYGDSITAQRRYTQDIEAFVYTRYPTLSRTEVIQKTISRPDRYLR